MYHLSLTVQTYPNHRVFSLSIYQATDSATRRLVRTYTYTEPCLKGGLFDESQDEFLTEVVDTFQQIQTFLRITDPE